MSVRNRAGMSGYGNKLFTGQLSLVRWLLGVIGLGVVSFVIGFFLIAPMLPSGRQAEAESQAGIPAGTTGNENTASHAATTPAQEPKPILTAPSSPAVSTANRPLPGPSIDPTTEDNTQSPGQPDSPPQGVIPSPPSQNNDQTGDAAANSPAKANTDSNDTSSSPRHRHHRRHSKDQATVQTPATPDGDTATSKPDSSDSQTQTPTETTSPADTQHTGVGAPTTQSAPDGPYRVQFGVFSTREAAEQEAQHVKDKGFRASVHTYTQDGRTLYRVQNGVYKDRARAETARQRLSDSGLDSSLSTP